MERIASMLKGIVCVLSTKAQKDDFKAFRPSNLVTLATNITPQPNLVVAQQLMNNLFNINPLPVLLLCPASEYSMYNYCTVFKGLKGVSSQK